MSKLEVSIPVTDEYWDFDVPAMAEALEKAYLSGQRAAKEYNRKTFPPSGVGYGSGPCPRRWYYEFNGDLTRIDDIDALQVSNMRYGTEAGARIADLFKKADLLVEAERLILTENPPIKGFVDVIIKWKDELAVGEIKTTKQEAFTFLKAEGKPRGYQLIQLLIYMKSLDINKGFMLYENKNTGEILIMPVEMTNENKRIVDEAFEWFQMVFDNKELPKRPFKKTSSECKYCPMKAFCWENKVDAGVVDLPILEIPQ